MLTHFWFDFACTFYTVLGAGLAVYLGTRRMPIEASLHRLVVPKLDTDAVWSLSSGGDVGVV